MKLLLITLVSLLCSTSPAKRGGTARKTVIKPSIEVFNHPNFITNKFFF